MTPRSDPSPALQTPLDCHLRDVRATVQAVAFWTSVVLPAGHLSVLLLLDLGRGGSLELLGALVAAHLVAIVLGHGHDPGGRGTDVDG